jgi:DNA-binding transcriptional ArsR family regulator
MPVRAKRAPARNVLTREQAETAARMFDVLADPTRLRIIHELLGGERTVTALAAKAGISQSATSHQLAKLRDLGLVVTRREGAAIHYTVASEHVASFFREALYHADHLVSGTQH